MPSTQEYRNQVIDINVIVRINSASMLIKEGKAEQCPISSSLGQWKKNTYGCISQFIGKAQDQDRFFLKKGDSDFFQNTLWFHKKFLIRLCPLSEFQRAKNDDNFYSLHGGGRRPRRQDSHHGPWQSQLLRHFHVPQETVW